EFQVIHIRGLRRIVTAFDVAVVRGEIQRSPADFVRDLRISALLEQERAEFIMAVLGRSQQRGPSESRDLVYVRAAGAQFLRAIEAIHLGGVAQRGKTAPVGIGLASECGLESGVIRLRHDIGAARSHIRSAPPRGCTAAISCALLSLILLTLVLLSL